MLRIGTFARLGGVSAKTLRDYDALRLFRPGWVDPATGYRAYSPAQLPELRRILALREMGVGLDEIGGLVSGGADLRAVLERRRAELERERDEVERAWPPSTSASRWPRRIRRARRRRPPRRGRAGRHPGRRGRRGPPAGVLRARGVRARRGASGEPATWCAPSAGAGGSAAVEVFVPVRGPVRETGRIRYRRLPACTAATIIHHGSYATLGTTRAALRRWIGSAGLRPAGDERILYLQFGAEPELGLPPGYLVERETEFVTELQVPLA